MNETALADPPGSAARALYQEEVAVALKRNGKPSKAYDPVLRKPRNRRASQPDPTQVKIAWKSAFVKLLDSEQFTMAVIAKALKISPAKAYRLAEDIRRIRENTSPEEIEERLDSLKRRRDTPGDRWRFIPELGNCEEDD